MIDALVLNRNLGGVCDALVVTLRNLLPGDSTITVVDAGSSLEKQSQFTTISVSDGETKKRGLRFARGMNLGLHHILKLRTGNQWVFLVPVDTEIVHWDLGSLMQNAARIPELVAIKPLESDSGYLNLLKPNSLKLAWNFEEGPWFVKKTFIEYQKNMNVKGDFFDSDNFRGYLLSLELIFKIYANGYCAGITNSIITREEESYLISDWKEIETEQVHENETLLVEEGILWLRNKYGIEDSWAFAQIVRTLYDDFLLVHPEFKSDAWGVLVEHN